MWRKRLETDRWARLKKNLPTDASSFDERWNLSNEHHVIAPSTATCHCDASISRVAVLFSFAGPSWRRIPIGTSRGSSGRSHPRPRPPTCPKPRPPPRRNQRTTTTSRRCAPSSGEEAHRVSSCLACPQVALAECLFLFARRPVSWPSRAVRGYECSVAASLHLVAAPKMIDDLPYLLWIAFWRLSGEKKLLKKGIVFESARQIGSCHYPAFAYRFNGSDAVFDKATFDGHLSPLRALNSRTWAWRSLIKSL